MTENTFELREAAKEALAALKHDAEAIGAAQTSEDIDWVKFGEATILKADAISYLEDVLS